MAKKVKSELRIAKKKAWDAFSTFIRTRDCIRFKRSLTVGMCVTCKREYPYNKLVAGHFIQGRTNSVLLDERLVYSQCWGCNTNPPYGKGGNYVEYFIFMEEEVGREKIDEFRALKHKAVKITAAEFLEKATSFAERTRLLVKEFQAV